MSSIKKPDAARPPPPPPPAAPKAASKPPPPSLSLANLVSGFQAAVSTAGQTLKNSATRLGSPDAKPPATTLLSEDSRDGQRNCLDAVADWLNLAPPQLRGRSEVLILKDTREGADGEAGHAVIRQGNGGIIDPSTGASYASFAEFNKGNTYQIAATVSGTAMQKVFAAKPNTPERQAAIDAAKIPKAAQALLLADSTEDQGSLKVPPGAPLTTLPGDPAGVSRVPVASLPEPQRSQLQATYAVQSSTGAPAGVSLVKQDGALYVAVDSQRQLVDVAGGQATVYVTQTKNALSAFAGANPADPKAMGQAFAAAMTLAANGNPVQALPTTAPLTAEQVAAYQALGYTVAVLDPSSGAAKLSGPAAGGTDVASVQGNPVYVVMGGPPLAQLGDLTPAQLAELNAAAKALPETPTKLDFANAIDGGDAFWHGNDENPAAIATFTALVAARYAPTPDSNSLERFTSAMYRLSEATGGISAQQSVALATAALNPSIAARGAVPGELASWAMENAKTPEAAQALLTAVGPERMAGFLNTLGLNAAENTPLWLNSGTRQQALQSFMTQVMNIPTTANLPSGTQANFFVTAAQLAGPRQYASASFREVLGKGMGQVFAMGDPALARSESARMGALLANEAVGRLLVALPPAQRSGVLVSLLDNKNLTAALVDHHNGNITTAAAYAQLQAVTTGLTGQFGINGAVPEGPNGAPLIQPQSVVPAPTPEVLKRNPAIAALGQPLTAGTIALAVQNKQLTPAQAASYLEDLARTSRDLANPDLARYGASPFTAGAISFFNGGNPIEKSRLTEYAGMNADSLFRLAGLVRGSTDPSYIAQAVTAGSAQDASFRASLPIYGESLAAMGDQVQGRRKLMIGLISLAAAISGPILAAATIPAGATLTLGGTTIGTAALQAGAAGWTAGYIGTVLNATGQYEETGTVQWGNAIAGGVVDGLTTYFGMRVSMLAAKQGTYGLSSILKGATIDGLGGFGSYVLGQPGALDGVLAGDPEKVKTALTRAGVGFGVSIALNSVFDLPKVDTEPQPGNIVMDGVGVFTPMPRLGAGAEGWRVHGYRGLKDITFEDLAVVLESGLHPRSVRSGEVEIGAIEQLPFFQRFLKGVQESAGVNVGEDVVMLTRSAALAEEWARATPVANQGDVSWWDFGKFIARVPQPSRAEYFAPAQFELLLEQQATHGGVPLLLKDRNGQILEVTMEQAQALMGTGAKINVTVEVAAPVENQVGFGSFYLSPSHQEEPIVGSIGEDGIIGVTILWDGVLPPK